MNGLTIKQDNFCQKYTERGNASEAYRYAYACVKMKPETINVRASELLKRGKIAVRVKELQEELKAKSSITKERMLSEFAKVGFSSIAHLHNTWVNLREFEELTSDQKAAIKSISTRTRRIVLDEQQVEIEEVKIELYDKLRALECINRMLGFDAPTKTEITGADGTPLIPRTAIDLAGLSEKQLNEIKKVITQ